MATLTPQQSSDLFRAPPTRYLDVGQGEVAYRRVGAGPDVVFVHGWPASGATFRGLLPHLVEHFTCHVFDLVGAGHSRFDRTTRINLDGHIAAVRRAIDLLDLSSYALVGHDSGGMIARHAVAGDPRLRAMALIDTELSQGVNWRFRQFLIMGKLPGFEHMLAWSSQQRGLRRNPFLLGDVFGDRDLLDGEFEEFFLAPLVHDPDRRWAAGQLIRSFDLEKVDTLAEVHAKITVPVQLVWGEDDPFFPVEQAREMVETFPDARLHVIPGGKLFVHEEHPGAVAAAMLETLREGA